LRIIGCFLSQGFFLGGIAVGISGFSLRLAGTFIALRPSGGQTLSEERAVVIERTAAEAICGFGIQVKGQALNLEGFLIGVRLLGGFQNGRTSAAGADKSFHRKAGGFPGKKFG